MTFARVLLVAILVPVAAYLALCAYVFAAQRRMLYYPEPPRLQGPLERFGIRRVEPPDALAFDVLDLPAADGAPTIVFFHGNAEQLLDAIPLGQACNARGWSFHAVEYPGYGRSPGVPNERDIVAVSENALRELASRGITRERTVLVGRSLGSGVAAELARRGFGSALLLISPNTSIPDVGARLFPWLPVRLLARDRFDTARIAPSVRVPVRILHGERDEVIPVDMGRTLTGLFPRATATFPERHGHNDLPDALVVRELAALIADSR